MPLEARGGGSGRVDHGHGDATLRERKERALRARLPLLKEVPIRKGVAPRKKLINI
jgi:hypothetical protein